MIAKQHDRLPGLRAVEPQTMFGYPSPPGRNKLLESGMVLHQAARWLFKDTQMTQSTSKPLQQDTS
jgi:hypothetical protein